MQTNAVIGSFGVRNPAQPTRGWALWVLLVAFPLALVSFLLVGIDRGEDFLLFGVMAILFLGLAAAFVATNGSLNAQWCTAPGFMTLLAALQFVAIPFLRFVNGDDQVDAYYLQAMTYLLLGFSVFWIACWLLKRPHRFEFVSEFGTGQFRITIAVTLLFALGMIGNLALWKLGILGYEVAGAHADASSSAIGALNALARLLTLAMLVSGIEVFGKHSKQPVIRFIFVSSAFFGLAFGLISGMKIEVLMPIFTLALLIGITQRRLPALIWTLPVLFVLLQPFVNAYRANLNAGYAGQINTIDGLTNALTKSFEDLTAGNPTSQRGLSRSAFDRYGSRLSDLALFHNVLQLPSADLLNGDETIWMAPFYPFIPRSFWPGKPVFNKGVRMSEAMGIGINTSTNVPGIADLYVLGGIAGILVGMFIWGAVIQIFMNSMVGGLSEKGVFIYVTVLYSLTNIERDMVAMIGGTVEGACITLILAKIIYGGKFFSLKSGLRGVTA